MIDEEIDLNEKIVDCKDEEVIKEKKLEDRKEMKTIEFNTLKNLNKEAFITIEFKIDKKLKRGMGFFCKIPDPMNDNKKIKILMTCYHVVNEFFENKNIVTISYKYGEGKTGLLNLKNRENCKNKKLDYACFQILEEDNIHDFLDIDENLILNDCPTQYLQKKVINIIYRTEISNGTIESVDDGNIYYNCDTDKGLSGSPISNKDNNLIIGIHQEYHRDKNLNKGLLIKSIFLDMRKQNIYFKEDNQE